MQYNISPETLTVTRDIQVRQLIEYLMKKLNFEMYKDNAVCANGAMYRKDVRGFLPELMEKMYGDRVIFKKRMLKAKQQYEKTPTEALEKEISRCNNIQMAKKISLNSAYGAIGNQYFRYYKLANAEAITLSGQVSIRWIENKMNDYLNKLLQTEERIMLSHQILIRSILILDLLLINFLLIGLATKQRLWAYLIRSVVTSWNHTSTSAYEELAVVCIGI